MCDKRFSQSSFLKKHCKNVHGSIVERVGNEPKFDAFDQRESAVKSECNDDIFQDECYAEHRWYMGKFARDRHQLVQLLGHAPGDEHLHATTTTW